MKNSLLDKAPKVASEIGGKNRLKRKREIRAVFQMHKGNALLAKSSNGRALEVCPAFSILGKVVDLDGRNPGYLIEFDSLLGKKQQAVLPIATMNSPDRIFKVLTDAGFNFPQEDIKNRITAVCMYLESYCPPDVVHLRIIRDGWITGPDGKLVYVLGDGVYGGKVAGLKVFRPRQHELVSKGSSAEWIALNKQLGNEPIAVLLACASLSSVLLFPFGIASILVFLVGSSGTGKTAGLKYASSFFDIPNSLLTWSGTDNGIEAAALQRQHKPLVIDEVGQATPQQFEKLSYLLTNAAGKLRANTMGDAVVPQQTHSVVISAGETAPLTLIEAKGKRAKQGQVTRLIAIPALMKHGIWDDLGEHQDGAAKTHYLLKEIDRVHGIAGRQFCKLVAGRIKQYKSLFAAVSEDFAKEICMEVHDGSEDSTPRRVLRSFALFAFTGLLAIEHKILPWSEMQVFNAMRVTYLRWLEDYKIRQPTTASCLIAPIRLFLESQRGSKFKPLDTWRVDHAGTVAGFDHKFRDGEECFLFYPAFFNLQLCGEQPNSLILGALKDAGYLRTGSRGVPSIQVNMPGGGKEAKRAFYAIRKVILLG